LSEPNSSLKKKGRATLAEVARRAGVSPTTASLVLRGKTQELRISEETDLRVRQAAREFDYSPNLLVHSLQQGKTGVISFFNAFRHRSSDDLYMDRLSTAIEHAAGRLGCDVLIHCDFSKSPEDLYRFINGGRADGLLFFAPRADDPLLPWLRKSNLPVVIIGAQDPEGVLPSVQDDVVSGLKSVADNLVALGHRRVAIVVERGPDFLDSDLRASILREFLKERGVNVPNDQVFNREGPADAVLNEILGQTHPPTAVFCWRDCLAYALLEACERKGVRVPEQLSVVGYDGLHWPAATRHIASSVQIDLKVLAEQAVALLDSYISATVEETKQVLIPVSFHPGTTIGPASEE